MVFIAVWTCWSQIVFPVGRRLHGLIKLCNANVTFQNWIRERLDFFYQTRNKKKAVRTCFCIESCLLLVLCNSGCDHVRRFSGEPRRFKWSLTPYWRSRDTSFHTTTRTLYFQLSVGMFQLNLRASQLVTCKMFKMDGTNCVSEIYFHWWQHLIDRWRLPYFDM